MISSSPRYNSKIDPVRSKVESKKQYYYITQPCIKWFGGYVFLPDDGISYEKEIEKQAELAAYSGAANLPSSPFPVQSLFCPSVVSTLL